MKNKNAYWRNKCPHCGEWLRIGDWTICSRCDIKWDKNGVIFILDGPNEPDRYGWRLLPLGTLLIITNCERPE